MLSNKFLQQASGLKLESLFKNDWQEKVHAAVADFLSDRGWRLDGLVGKQNLLCCSDAESFSVQEISEPM